MKKVCNMSNEDRQFVLRLLHIIKDDFERAFLELAKSDSLKGKRRFAAYWYELAERAFTKSEEDDEVESLNDFDSMPILKITDAAIRLAERNKLRANKFLESYARYLLKKGTFKNFSEAKSVAYRNIDYMASVMSQDALKLVCDTYQPLLDEKGGSQC